jgi:hypothetical protein
MLQWSITNTIFIFPAVSLSVWAPSDSARLQSRPVLPPVGSTDETSCSHPPGCCCNVICYSLLRYGWSFTANGEIMSFITWYSLSTRHADVTYVFVCEGVWLFTAICMQTGGSVQLHTFAWGWESQAPLRAAQHDLWAHLKCDVSLKGISCFRNQWIKNPNYL